MMEEAAYQAAMAHAWLDVNAEPGDCWEVLIDGDVVYLLVRRPFCDPQVLQHELPLRQLKAVLMAVYSGNIDKVSIAIPSDAKQSGATDLLTWLTAADWGKFAISSYQPLPIHESTADHVARFKRRAVSGIPG